MNLREQIGYTGTEPNDILKFKDFNPINRGTIDASTKLGIIKSKDLHNTTKDIISTDEDDEEEIDDEDEYGGELSINGKPFMNVGDHHWTHPYGFSGAPMAIGNSVSESHGVPMDIEPWIDLLYSFIRNQVYNFISKVRDTDKYNIKIDDFDSKSIITHVKGKEFNSYIKKYIPKDNKLKFRDIEIDLGISTIPDEYYTSEIWEASFSDDNAILKGGIYHNVRFMLDILIPESIIKLRHTNDVDDFMEDSGVSGKIIEYLSHELTHGYEFFNRKLSNIDNWKDRLLNTNRYLVENQLLSNVSPTWKFFLRLIYISLDFEINARVTQVYYYLLEKNPKTKYDFISELKDSEIWNEMVSLRDFNTDEFYNKFSYKSSDEDLKDVFLSLNVYSEEDFEEFDIKYLLVKELVNLWDKNIDNTNELYNSGEMNRLSPFYINNPMEFFKKFEKRFHKKAKIWERKMYRLSSKFDLD